MACSFLFLIFVVYGNVGICGFAKKCNKNCGIVTKALSYTNDFRRDNWSILEEEFSVSEKKTRLLRLEY